MTSVPFRYTASVYSPDSTAKAWEAYFRRRAAAVLMQATVQRGGGTTWIQLI